MNYSYFFSFSKKVTINDQVQFGLCYLNCVSWVGLRSLTQPTITIVFPNQAVN